MLKIRLQRVGRKHEPVFRLVLTDSKNSTKSGRFKEILGLYDPRKSIDSLNSDRIKHWLSVGAQATDTVHNLLVTHKVIEGEKRNVLPKKTPPAPKEEVAESPEKVDEASSKEETKTPEADSSPATEEKTEEKKEEVPASQEEKAPEEAPAKEESQDEPKKEEVVQ